MQESAFIKITSWAFASRIACAFPVGLNSAPWLRAPWKNQAQRGELLPRPHKMPNENALASQSRRREQPESVP